MPEEEKQRNNSSPGNVDWKKLQQELQTIFPQSSAEQARKLCTYLDLLMLWNKRINLVGTKDWKSTFEQLVTDSLHLAVLLPELPLPPDPRCIDVGAGAGIPGIPLRIFWNAGEYILVEPKQKKASFLHQALHQLDLLHTSLQARRLQELDAQSYAADLILSRGALAWEKFLHVSRPYIRESGLILVFASEQWPTSRKAPHGWLFQTQEPYSVQDNKKRYFWLFSPKKDPS